MFSACRDLCKSKKEREKGRKDKKEKHGGAKGDKEDGKGNNKHKMKNVHTFSIIGQGKKNTDQDTACMIEMLEESTLVRFFGVYDGHGDFGKEVIIMHLHLFKL